MKWLGRFSHILEQFTNSEKEHPEILNEHNKHILSVFIKNYGHRTLSNNFRSDKDPGMGRYCQKIMIKIGIL